MAFSAGPGSAGISSGTLSDCACCDCCCFLLLIMFPFCQFYEPLVEAVGDRVPGEARLACSLISCFRRAPARLGASVKFIQGRNEGLARGRRADRVYISCGCREMIAGHEHRREASPLAERREVWNDLRNPACHSFMIAKTPSLAL